MKLFVLFLAAGLAACSQQPHPSDETFRAMAESCKQQGLVMNYHNNGAFVVLKCEKVKND
jgi:hypothetical protein